MERIDRSMESFNQLFLKGSNLMSNTTEIGSLKEKVTILDAPTPGPNGRIGRIRHSNGENADIDFKTLQELEQRARTGGKDSSSDVLPGVFYA